MKNDRVYLVHITECIESIKEYTATGKEDFYELKIIQDAVIRNLEIIGEATKKVSAELKDMYYKVPWREMAGLRDVLIHDYFGVDLDIVWNVVNKELPNVYTEIQNIIDDMF